MNFRVAVGRGFYPFFRASGSDMAVIPSFFCQNTFSLVVQSETPTVYSVISLLKPKAKGFCISIDACHLSPPKPRRRRFSTAVHGLHKDLNQKTVQDDEVKDLGVKAALSMLKFYKREISPLLPNSCRYVPTCSEYSMEAYKKYGVVKGTILTAWRLCRCNPLGGSGFDPPRWFDEEKPEQ